MLYLALALSLAMGALILSDWRRALPWLFLIGVLQDVLRKLTPGAPAAYILWIGVIFGLIVLVAYAQGSLRGRWRTLALGDAGLRQAWGLVVLVVVLQAAHAVLRWGNPLIGVLGLAFYLGPVLALMVGMAYAQSQARIDRLLTVYVLVMVPAALTVYLSADYGAQWPVLRDVGAITGTQIIIYHGGQALESISGVFRVGELAAWHAATSIAFLSILVMRRPSLVRLIGAGVLAALLLGVIVLSGRRKMLMTLTLFFSYQWVLFILLRRGVTRLSGAMLAFALFLAVAFSLLGHEEQDLASSTSDSVSAAYADRGLTVFESTDQRLDTTLSLVQSAWSRSGGIGVGAGMAGQGSRFAGGGDVSARVVGGSAEAGMGFIIVELGVPGLLAMGWLMFLLVRRLWQGLRMLARVNEQLLLYAVSFASLLIANLATFGVAVQLYSDYVVLITLGMVAGMMFVLADAGIRHCRWKG